MTDFRNEQKAVKTQPFTSYCSVASKSCTKRTERGEEGDNSNVKMHLKGLFIASLLWFINPAAVI